MEDDVCTNRALPNPRSTRRSTRPPEYRKIYVDYIDKYIQHCERRTGPKSLVQKVRVSKNRYNCKTHTWNEVDIPTIRGYAKYLKVSRATIYHWKAKYPEFCDALEELKDAEKDMLIRYGLSGYFNSRIALMLLNVNHAMVPRQHDDSKKAWIEDMFMVHELAENIVREKQRKRESGEM